MLIPCCNYLIYKVEAYNLGNAGKRALATSISKSRLVLLTLLPWKHGITATIPRTGLILARMYMSRSTNGLPMKLPLGYSHAARDEALGDSLQSQLKM